MTSANPRPSARRSSPVARRFMILLLLLLPLTACGRYKARKALEKNRYFSEILKRESRREIGEDGFFRDNLLGNRDPEVRRWCAIALGRIGDRRALPLLYGALHSSDEGARAAAAFGIGEIENRARADARCSSQDSRAVLELFRLLDDASMLARMRAVEALGKIESPAEAGDLVRRLERFNCCGSESDRALIGTGIAALARLRSPAAVPLLDRWAGSGGLEIRRAAADARAYIRSGAIDAQPAAAPPAADAGAAAPCGPEQPNEARAAFVTDARADALAAFRKNSTIARIETTRGAIEIELFREDAPITAESFVGMALRGVYNDTAITATPRIVEGGDPGEWPGLQRSIPSEVNMRPFERGRVGMAVSGKDSDAGRFFITLAPQPLMDGVNTCFGHVVSGMQVADGLRPGDRIHRIVIREYVHFHDYQRYGK